MGYGSHVRNWKAKDRFLLERHLQSVTILPGPDRCIEGLAF